MSVVGFDIGNFKSSIGLARAGGVEIIANEYSDRITPTYVAFTNNERYMGHAAKQQEITNSQNTMSSFKRLLGRKYHDSQVQQEKHYQAMRISAGPDDKIQYSVDYLNEVRTLSVEQVMAMFITKLKSTVEMNLNGKMTDCVISVPSYYTDAERRALLDSAQVAGLNCLKLMNETTAVALAYGIYNANLPEPTEQAHHVVFVDMGYTQTQASLVAFNKGKLRVLATTFDNALGGRDFDRVLMDYFQKDFKARYNLDAYSNVRAKLRLTTECEKVKKLMSSNASPIPINIECFMNDVDVSGKIKRDEFEALAEPLLARLRRTLSALISDTKVKNIDLVEIVGGSTRIPIVKTIIQEVYGKEISTTLNQDEACARGCTLMCAILSPTFKVKEFKIEDCQLFPITLNWKGAETDDNELEVFPLYDKIPMSKLLTIYKREPFEIEARYRYPNNIPFSEARIGKFVINDVRPTKQNENSEIKLKARITKSGIFEISSPQLIEVLEAGSGPQPEEAMSQSPDQAKPEVTEEEDANKPQENGADEPSSTPTDAAAPAPAATPTKKRKIKAIDLPLVAKVPQLSKQELNSLFEAELAMISQDRKEKERSEAKNSVEEYIYEMREKLSSEYSKYISEQDKNTFSKLLEESESWLYSEEAENQEKSVFVDRLNKMKFFGEPMRKRFREAEERPHTFEELGKSMQLINKALHQYHDQNAADDKYKHLDKAEIEKVQKAVSEKQAWFEEKSYQVTKMKLHEDPVVWNTAIRDEKNSLDKMAWAILNKPKPKVEPPPPTPAAAPEGAAPAPGGTNASQTPSDKNMDVD